MGPSAVRDADLSERLIELGYDVTDEGNIVVRNPEMTQIRDRKLKYLPEMVIACQKLADHIEGALEEGSIPLILGADHSIAIGSVSGLASFHRKRGDKVGVIWFDAHGDMNTRRRRPQETFMGCHLPRSLVFGAKELTHISGFSPKVYPEDCVLIGARSIDPEEAVTLKNSGIRVVTMRELDERGMSEVMDEAVWRASRRTVGFHVSMEWILSIPITRRVSARRFRAVQPIVKATSRWRRLRIRENCFRSSWRRSIRCLTMQIGPLSWVSS
jgi:arginase